MLCRLKTREQFQAVLDGRLVIAKSNHFALHRLQLESYLDVENLFSSAHFVGALVPKKWAKRAVTRNLIKRQVYTLSSHWNIEKPLFAVVVRLRLDFSRKQFFSCRSDDLMHAVRSELRELFIKANLMDQSSVDAPYVVK